MQGITEVINISTAYNNTYTRIIINIYIDFFIYEREKK